MKMNETVKQGLSTKSRYESKKQKFETSDRTGSNKMGNLRSGSSVAVHGSLRGKSFSISSKETKSSIFSEHMINTDYPKILIICKILNLARSEVI